MAEKLRIVALIVAAGKGERAGGGTPKQYRTIRGKPMLRHAIEHLCRHDAIDRCHVVIGAGQEALYGAATEGLPLPSPVIGGATRQASVRHGLEAIAKAGGADIVLIHDAARPFLPPAVVDRLLAACGAHDGAIPALSVTDSLARKDGSSVARDDFVHVQTPQAFRFDAILAAHRRWKGADTATDDGEIGRAAGLDIVLTEGDKALDKFTLDEDFRPFSGIDVRTGSGFDVHAFAPGDHVWLGGVQIPHRRGLAGHSDADVALHALTDAFLGAIGAGDIGTHFPPSQAEWKDAASWRFLEKARDLAAERGFAPLNLDVTIICEAPKIGPHRAAMRSRIADILAIDEDRISVKATTTEGLGFTGRKEGIAAQAIVTLAKENMPCGKP